MDVQVTVGGVATSIKILRPLHPLEDISVEFTEEAIGTMITFARGRDGTGVAALSVSRSYNKTKLEGDNLWNMGGGRQARRIDGKLKYVPTAKSAASSAPTEHDEEEDDRIIDCPSGNVSADDANPGGEATASGAEDQQNMPDESS